MLQDGGGADECVFLVKKTIRFIHSKMVCYAELIVWWHWKNLSINQWYCSWEWERVWYYLYVRLIFLRQDVVLPYYMQPDYLLLLPYSKYGTVSWLIDFLGVYHIIILTCEKHIFSTNEYMVLDLKTNIFMNNHYSPFFIFVSFSWTTEHYKCEVMMAKA